MTKTSRGDFAIGTSEGDLILFNLESRSLSDDS